MDRFGSKSLPVIVLAWVVVFSFIITAAPVSAGPFDYLIKLSDKCWRAKKKEKRACHKQYGGFQSNPEAYLDCLHDADRNFDACCEARDEARHEAITTRHEEMQDRCTSANRACHARCAGRAPAKRDKCVDKCGTTFNKCRQKADAWLAKRNR